MEPETKLLPPLAPVEDAHRQTRGEIEQEHSDGQKRRDQAKGIGYTQEQPCSQGEYHGCRGMDDDSRTWRVLTREAGK
ncbi:hypothetical protein EPA93_14385 [Ktedonosporobacter rubrisoli]|uniref:Uncharacterized protein n=1 Tax=Ktedonosporobacter rubrisoli TaxID=2509675 RepID=A0A4P6JPI1_KTERU|nr:hypothetical protein [Ktedonosporobacter rubrisoli]QBD77123.1 hypothetical protein EPA93_14385 [Ktedonosporobacter rubrisoli]